MLRHASCLCRHVLGSTAEALLQQHPSSCVTMQYAACSLLRTVTANTNVLADHVQQQQQQRMLSSGPAGTPAGDGIIIDPSAVQVRGCHLVWLVVDVVGVKMSVWAPFGTPTSHGTLFSILFPA